MVNQEQLPAPRNLPWCGWAPLGSGVCQQRDWYVESPWEDACQIIVMLPPAKWSWGHCQSSGESFLLVFWARNEVLLWGRAVGGRRRQFADKWVNDTLIMVTLKDWEFSSLLVSVLGLREVMLSHKDLHVAPCWVCLYLSCVASSFVPLEPLTGSSCLAVVLFWSMIIKKIKPKHNSGTMSATLLPSNLIYWKVFSPGIWINLDGSCLAREKRQLGAVSQLQTAWARSHIWTHPKFKGIFMCKNLIWL